MTFSVPSFLAAATSLSMPPPAEAEVCVFQSVPPFPPPPPPELDEEQPAATRATAATTPVKTIRPDARTAASRLGPRLRSLAEHIHIDLCQSTATRRNRYRRVTGGSSPGGAVPGCGRAGGRGHGVRGRPRRAGGAGPGGARGRGGDGGRSDRPVPQRL